MGDEDGEIIRSSVMQCCTGFGKSLGKSNGFPAQ